MSESKKTEPKVVGTQKIECSVVECVHNCIDDSTCRLNKIRVTPREATKMEQDSSGTLCSSYHYIGDENVANITGRD